MTVLEYVELRRSVSYLALSSDRLATSPMSDSKYAFLETCGKDKLSETSAVDIVFAEFGADAIINKPSIYID